MNVRHGQEAVIIRDDLFPENVGCIVLVRYRARPYSIDTLAKPHWACLSLGSQLRSLEQDWFHPDGGDSYWQSADIADEDLRPLVGAPGEDEALQAARKCPTGRAVTMRMESWHA